MKCYIFASMNIRPAHNEDLAGIMAVLAAAKEIMRASGNDGQWVGGYPSEEVILEDIARGNGFEREPNIRIDTHRNNRIMQHCIDRYGFSYCGIIYLESGDERLAYQLIR